MDNEEKLEQSEGIVEDNSSQVEPVVVSEVADEATNSNETLEESMQAEDIIPPTVENEIKTSGTATEEELVIDATKAQSEVLDEFDIKMDVINEEKKQKKNVAFIIIITLLIIVFIVLLPLIVKKVGF